MLMPSDLSGMDTIAPSGKFWIAIPMDNASAPSILMEPLFLNHPAHTTPTAIPSGILCKVTARTSFVVFFKVVEGPSSVLSICVWGTTLSNKSKNNVPIQKPANAGIKDNFPIFSDCSMAGIKRLHIDAATITPAAKPARIFLVFTFSSLRITKTHAEPRVVPKKGSRIVIIRFLFIKSFSFTAWNR